MRRPGSHSRDILVAQAGKVQPAGGQVSLTAAPGVLRVQRLQAVVATRIDLRHPLPSRLLQLLLQQLLLLPLLILHSEYLRVGPPHHQVADLCESQTVEIARSEENDGTSECDDHMAGLFDCMYCPRPADQTDRSPRPGPVQSQYGEPLRPKACFGNIFFLVFIAGN